MSDKAKPLQRLQDGSWLVIGIKTTKVDLNVLEATEGHYIYKKSDDIKEAYFTKKVYLGVSDSADNYAEITDSEYDKEMKRREDEQNTAQEETESVPAE